MQKGCILNKIQIVLKSFVPVLFYNLSHYIIVRLCKLGGACGMDGPKVKHNTRYSAELTGNSAQRTLAQIG